ncbi:Hypothetical predicted protein, partial [Mytilus galloprovincialis]
MGNHDELLSYNGRINNHQKYEETVLPRNEFRLKIINVTEKDVNVTYRCRYGFDTATYFIEVNKSVSLQKSVNNYHSLNTSSHSTEGQIEERNFKANQSNDTHVKGNFKTKVILLSALVPLAILALVAVIFIVKRQQTRT